MKKIIMAKAICLLLLGISWGGVPYQPKRVPVISPALEGIGSGTVSVWVYFTDRGFHTEQEYGAALQRAEDQLLPRARWRRSKVKDRRLVAYCDLPVHRQYAQAVLATGVQKRVVSRYINAISVDATIGQIRTIANLPFVRAIDPVAKGYRPEPDVTPVNRDNLPTGAQGTDQLDYGPSRSQLDQINVIEAHEAGYSGEGVLLCLLDTGYWLEHEAFDSLRLVAAWDFINGDSIVWNEPGQDSSWQHNHGTYTLSASAGLTPGTLYGPAYHASILAGKTESIAFEQPIEEDWYVAGLEWADSLGGEIVSTSLGYKDWYTFEDLDGNTAVTTVGVDIAVANGMVCVTAAGNERQSSWGHIIAPADADSVIACGAVDSFCVLASFSSPGPTFDGRIKPEVCAQGVDTWCAVPYFPSAYGGVSGTSLSTPLVGGSVALILEAHPDWTPMMVREALMETADNASCPDNDYGWGIIDVMAAIDYQFSSTPRPPAHRWEGPRLMMVRGSYPNPFNTEVTLEYEIIEPGDIRLEVYNLLGQRVDQQSLGHKTEGKYRLTWKNDAGSSGLYFYCLSHPEAVHWGRWIYLK
jgi:serine protease AprX